MDEQLLSEYNELLEFSKNMPTNEFKLSVPGLTFSIKKFVLLIKTLLTKLPKTELFDILMKELEEDLPPHTDNKTTYFNRINYWKKLEGIVETINMEFTRNPGVIIAINNKQYISSSRIDELRIINSKYDLRKLIRLCEELNIAFTNKCYISCVILVRAIIDHIPPIFGFNTFTIFSNSYSGAKSFKDLMIKLDVSLRKIADSYLHVQIREKETLPEEQQINFSHELDVLLAEIVRIIH